MNLINQRFGKWLVLERGDSSSTGRTRWRCVCNCGNTCLVQASHLKNGSSTQCKACSKFGGYEEISLSYWHSLINNAKRRDYEFNISIQEAWNQFIQQGARCALTGQSLVFARNHQTDTQTASLDRIDSSKGYISGNIQWVHKDINLLKGSLDDRKFIELCRLVAFHHEPLSHSGHRAT